MTSLDSIIPYGKVLRPSAKEFSDFARYVYKVVEQERSSGLGFVKVG